MFDFRFYFDEYCREHSLDLCLSFDMPCGYETANGMFDIASKTVFLNAERLRSVPDYEKAFFLFHELRHASQYLSLDYYVRDMIQIQKSKILGMLELELNALAH